MLVNLEFSASQSLLPSTESQRVYASAEDTFLQNIDEM